MQYFLGDLTISRRKGSTKTCFETLQTYHSVGDSEPGKIIYVRCYKCLKILIYYILSDLYCV